MDFTSSTKIISPPMKVRFLGWTSDTYTLQRFGWSVSVLENVIYNSMYIAIKHDGLKIYGVSDMYSMDYQMLRHSRDGGYGELRDMEVNFSNLASKYTVMVHGNNIDFNKFSPIDAEPQMINFEPKSLEDLCVFKKVVHKEEEIIVDPKSVSELMEQIVKMQDPKQAEIRERRRKERARNNGMLEFPGENTEVICNILRLVA